MFACPLFCEFREPSKTVKLKGANTDTIPLASALKTCGWFITKGPVHTGARVLGAVLLVVTSM